MEILLKEMMDDLGTLRPENFSGNRSSSWTAEIVLLVEYESHFKQLFGDQYELDLGQGAE